MGYCPPKCHPRPIFTRGCEDGVDKYRLCCRKVTLKSTCTTSGVFATVVFGVTTGCVEGATQVTNLGGSIAGPILGADNWACDEGMTTVGGERSPLVWWRYNCLTGLVDFFYYGFDVNQGQGAVWGKISVSPTWHLSGSITIPGNNVSAPPHSNDYLKIELTCAGELCESITCFPRCLGTTVDCDGVNPSMRDLHWHFDCGGVEYNGLLVWNGAPGYLASGGGVFSVMIIKCHDDFVAGGGSSSGGGTPGQILYISGLLGQEWTENINLVCVDGQISFTQFFSNSSGTTCTLTIYTV